LKRDTLIVGAVIAAIAVTILGGSLLCTWAIAHGASMQWRLLFRLFCHGIPRRCLSLWNVPMPICARCTAIYGGTLLGLVLLRLLPAMSERAARFVMVAAATPVNRWLAFFTSLKNSCRELSASGFSAAEFTMR